LPHLDQTVAAEARRLFADSVVHDEHALESVLRTFGPEHVVLGSDWPYPMGVQDPVQALGDVNAAMKEAIVVRNPERLLSRMSS
jgi:aminocarboxymuconate-semialdehyde decarboxylase